MPLTANQETPQYKLVKQGLALTLAFFFVIALANRTIVTISGLQEWSAEMFIISRFEYWLWLALIYLYATRCEKQPLLLWPEKRYCIGFYFASVLGILLIVAIGNLSITYALLFSGWYKPNPIMAGLGLFSIPLKLFICFTAGVVEEFVMRGYLMPRLQLFFKSKHWPVVISSVIFGLAHIRWGTLANVVVPIFIGLIFAYHYQKYRNIKVLIICHFLWDMIGFMLIPHATK
nr:type II CAAX endopeptidase family protein [uncultured Mucilaginibacter sp.]